MMQYVKWFQSKPKDSTIRLLRLLFSLFIILIIVLGWDTYTLGLGIPKWLKPLLFIFALIGIVRSSADPGVFRRKIWRWVNVGIGIMMILLSFFVIEPVIQTPEPENNVTTASGILLSNLGQTETSPTDFQAFLDTDFWFAFLGWVLVFTALLFNGKNITTKNERYGEVVKKIRI